MQEALTSRQESTSRYLIERSFCGDRSAQDVAAAIIQVHCSDGGRQ